MAEYMREVPRQKIKAGEKHICPECFHYRVCMGRVNRPCFECDCFVPAADVRENVKGAWARCDKHIVKCPKCGNFLDMRGVNAGRGDANFCPNCGAQMGGAKDG